MTLRRRILLPVTAAMVVLMLLVIVGVRYVSNRLIAETLEHEVETSHRVIKDGTQAVSEHLEGFIYPITSNQNFIAAMRAADRHRLWELGAPYLERWKALSGVTHFYFHTTDGTTLLRVHMKERFGDRNTRRSLQSAMDSGRTVAATEVGLTGEWVHRVVVPWKVAGQLIGYVELGVDMEHVYKVSSQHVATTMLVLLDKQLIQSRDIWDARRKALGLSPFGWDTLPEHVIAIQTGAPIDPAMLTRLDLRSPSDAIQSNVQGKQLSTHIHPLLDANGSRQLGTEIQVLDVSAIQRTADQGVVLYSTAIIVLLLVIAASLYGYLGGIQRQMDSEGERMQARLDAQSAELRAYQTELESKVAQRTQELNQAQTVAHVGSWIWDAQTGAFTASDETYRICSLPLGSALTPEVILGCIHPDDRDKVQAAWRDSLQTGTYEIEHRVLAPGEFRWVHQRAQAQRTADGAVIRAIGTVQDITDAKKVDTELEAYRKGLEQLVEQRTQELQAAKVAAETANITKSAFLANMSHEIRTPMNGVLGMLEVLAHSPLEPDEQTMVETIRQSADMLLGIIDDILDISKIEAGKLNLAKESMSLETELDTVVGMMDRIAMAKQVDLSVFYDPHLPREVLGDGLRLRQVLTNLLGNAIKFSANLAHVGRIQFRAELEQCGPESAWVKFSICDNGIGMDAPTLARLFAPFEQADISTTRKYGGTGLGLSISKNLTDMMGGELRVESTLEQGSCFDVRVPFKLVSECPNTESPYDLTGTEFMVVTDESRYASDYTHYLEHAGATTHALPTLEAAWKLIETHYPDTRVCVVVMQDPGKKSAQEIVHRLLDKQPADHVHFVNIAYLSVERGKRRKVRRLSDKVVHVDREAMTRSRFLEAAAAACGRVVLNAEDDIDHHVHPAGAALKVLVAEDNDVNREVIQRQLALLGHQADIVEDGSQAFARWKSGHYDLVLTDLHMPNTDGYQLTLMIRDAERTQALRRTPIVALTANAMKGQQEFCLTHGMDGYLSKPLELRSLQQALARWQPAAAPQPAAHDTPAPPAPAPSVAEEPALPTFDRDRLSQMVGNVPAVHQRLLEKYLLNAEQQAQKLHGAIDAGDVQTAALVAHALKGASRAVGAMRLGELCQQLELAGKAQALDQLQTQLAAFDAELQAACAAIKASRG